MFCIIFTSEFLALTNRQLGSNIIQQACQKLNLPDYSVTKRPHDNSSTGYTPEHKRPLHTTNIDIPPPAFSLLPSSSTDCQEISQSTEFSSQIDILQREIQLLKSQLEAKDSHIADLKDHIQLLKITQRFPSITDRFNLSSSMDESKSTSTFDSITTSSLIHVPIDKETQSNSSMQRLDSSPTIGSIRSPSVQCPSTPSIDVSISNPISFDTDQIVPQTPPLSSLFPQSIFLV